MTHAENIAAVCHEANRAYCRAYGDYSQAHWHDTPSFIRASVIAGVQNALDKPKLTPKQSHDAWLKYKEAEGWTFGRVKNFDVLQHPNMVPWEELPVHEQGKDVLFLAIVRALADKMPDEPEPEPLPAPEDHAHHVASDDGMPEPPERD